MKYIFILLSCFFSLSCLAQNDGYLIMEQDQRIEQLIQRQKDIHNADNTIEGFRIQIFMESGNDAVEHANITMEEFKAKYPDIPIYLIFGQPYYRLRIGDFRTRLEAEKAYQTLSKEYKKAFITSDKIQLPYNVFCDDVMPNDIFDEEYQFDNDTIYNNIYYED
ncbi:MAG: SPOR domain-containing protein [Lentimicrobiaceae bacterium]|nr:SPOR domain-containing protein [Lentimicrobiaceae bacterium]